MTRSEAIHHLYAVFNTHPLYDINLIKLNNILDEVEAHEREACAKLCESNHELISDSLDGYDTAAAIRARGET